MPGVTHVDAGSNTGFAGGCNLGARHATGEFLAFVNSDAVVRPDALRCLVEVAERPAVAFASASLRLADRPEMINSAGNPVHYLRPVLGRGLRRERRPTRRRPGHPVGHRRRVRGSPGGLRLPGRFQRADVRLLRGRRAEPARLAAGLARRLRARGVVLHHYEFSRNSEKFYLLERNRLMLVLTLFESRNSSSSPPRCSASGLRPWP